MPERKTLNEDLFYRGSSANLPRLHTCKNKVPFWDFSQFAITMGINTVPQPPSSRDLALCDFWLFPKLRGCPYETIEEMKEAVTKVTDTLTQEDFHGTFQKLLEHCRRRRLLQRGLEFHVCTINKSAHTKKAWKLI